MESDIITFADYCHFINIRSFSIVSLCRNLLFICVSIYCWLLLLFGVFLLSELNKKE